MFSKDFLIFFFAFDGLQSPPPWKILQISSLFFLAFCCVSRQIKSGIHLLELFFFVCFVYNGTYKGRIPFESLNRRLSSTFSFSPSSASGRLLRSNRYTTVAQSRIGISLLKKPMEELVLVLNNADGIRKCSCPFRLRLRPKS